MAAMTWERPGTARLVILPLWIEAQLHARSRHEY
jgi:hypothetical protein